MDSKSELTSETGRARGATGLIDRIQKRWDRIRAELLRTLLRAAPVEQRRLLVLTVFVGVACGLTAVLFHVALRRAADFLSLKAFYSDSWIAWLLLTPTIGGLVAGILLEWWVPEARGSGIPEIKKAYLESRGRVPVRVVIGKFVVSLISIGSGASLGREGPTAQICAGISSLFGSAGALSRRALRRMLPVGVAAGIAAAFNAPIAAVTFAIEEIVGDLDQAVLSGVVIAAATAAAIERGILGQHPLLETSATYAIHHAASPLLYVVLGILAAIVSTGFTRSLIWLRGWFKQQSMIPRWCLPAVGGAVTGALAIIAVYWIGTGGITGGGYTTLTEALAGHVALKAVLVLVVFKVVATVFSYASGGSGGVFAPSLFIGGMLGCAVGYLDQWLFGTGGNIGAFALVGMGAVFAGTIRAPITSVLIIFEMTQGYSLIPPLMIANMTSYLLARHWDRLPLYDALLEQDGFPARAQRDARLSRVPVGTVMTTKVAMVRESSTVDESLDELSEHEYAIYPVVAENRSSFVGFINRYRLYKASRDGEGANRVGDYVTTSSILHPDTPLSVAVERLHQEGAHLLPVVERGSDRRFLGLLTSTDVVRAEAEDQA